MTKKQNQIKVYHFVECGLDYIYLLNGFKIEQDDKFGKSVTICNADNLQREIAKTVLLYKEKMQGQEIRFFRSLLKLTQEQLGSKLGVTRETVVRWENDDYEISQTADNFLRIIVLEGYLDKSKAVDFFEKHKKDRTHYKTLEMIEKQEKWQSKIAA